MCIYMLILRVIISCIFLSSYAAKKMQVLRFEYLWGQTAHQSYMPTEANATATHNEWRGTHENLPIEKLALSFTLFLD